jgi:hypothetical protein
MYTQQGSLILISPSVSEIRVDERNAGNIVFKVVNSIFTRVGPDGVELDEGGIQLDLVNIRAYGNKDEAIKVSEADKGDVDAYLARVVAVDNGDDGIQIDEESDGDLELGVTGSIVSDNAKSNLKVEQQEPGEGALCVRGSQIDNISTGGVSEI